MIVKYFTIVACCVGVLGIFGGLILPDPAHAAETAHNAEAPAGASVSSAPTGALTLDALARGLSRHEIVSGTFTQERTLKGFPKPLQSSGHFVFAAGKGVLWATDKPFPSEVLLSEKAISTRNDYGTETLSAADNPQLEVVNRFVMELVSGRYEALDDAFTTVLTGTAADWHLALEPKAGFVKSIFSSIEVSGDEYPRAITLVTKDGETTRVRLADQKPLDAVPEALTGLK